MKTTSKIETIYTSSDSLPDSSTRPCVATSVSGVLYFWQSEPLKTMIAPQDGLPAVDPFEIVQHALTTKLAMVE